MRSMGRMDKVSIATSIICVGEFGLCVSLVISVLDYLFGLKGAVCFTTGGLPYCVATGSLLVCLVGLGGIMCVCRFKDLSGAFATVGSAFFVIEGILLLFALNMEKEDWLSQYFSLFLFFLLCAVCFTVMCMASVHYREKKKK